MKIGKADYFDNELPREQPDPGDVYAAVVGCIEDVGFQAAPGQEAKRKVAIGFELAWKDSKGRREVLFRKCNLNLWKKADGLKSSDLRAILDVLRPGADNSEADTVDFVGLPCRVLVGKDAKGRAKVESVLPPKGEIIKPERDYTQPFGLWKWLLEHRAPAGPVSS